MKITLLRLSSNDQGTRGVLILPDGVFCNTFELPWRDNKPKVSCIPCGAYPVIEVQSPRFGKIYGVEKVPRRSVIRIHSGNLAGDTLKGLKSHVEGCILLGKRWGNINGQLAIMNSRPTLRLFMEKMDMEPFTLSIQDERIAI
jgi:hypothetical protein